jgi:PIN domain nuclease of toxin-antitoxin system
MIVRLGADRLVRIEDLGTQDIHADLNGHSGLASVEVSPEILRRWAYDGGNTTFLSASSMRKIKINKNKEKVQMKKNFMRWNRSTQHPAESLELDRTARLPC